MVWLSTATRRWTSTCGMRIKMRGKLRPSLMEEDGKGGKGMDGRWLRAAVQFELLQIWKLDNLDRDCLAGGLENASVYRPIRAPAELAGDAHVVIRMLQLVELAEPHNFMVAAQVHQ